RDDGLTRHAVADRPDQRRLALGKLVEEKVFLRREVVEDGLLGDARRGSDLGDRDVVEAALDEEAHRRVRELAPRRQLLRLTKPHLRIVYDWLQLQQGFSCYNFSPTTENKGKRGSPCSHVSPTSSRVDAS